MTDALYLAFAYLRHNLVRSLVIVGAFVLILISPVVTRLVLNAAEAQLSARAQATPLMIGAKGSALDLIMNGLYFSADRPELITMADVDAVWDSGLAIAVPLYVRYTAGGQPVVGTTLDYFEARNLTAAQGRPFAVLGEAVLGATAARRLGLGPGDLLITDPENLFDLAGAYPLELKVVGVLGPTGSADDTAVFVDMNTAWVIDGLGHGHDDVVAADAVVATDGGNLTAFAGLTEFTRITDDNIDSFHFHGSPDSYPVTSILAVPWDKRSETILRGRYIAPDRTRIAVVPGDVIQGLLSTIFRIGRILDAVFSVVGLAAVVAIGLALYLSMRLRKAETDTAFRLGCHRSMIARLLAAEVAVLSIAAAAFALLAVAIIRPQIQDVAIWLVTTQG